MEKISTNLNTSQKRRSGIEILRIIAMLLIVIQHFSNHTDRAEDLVTVSTVWLDVMELWGRLAVNIFIIITGYFYVSSFTLKKASRLVFQVTFYSVVMTAVSVLIGAAELRIKLIPRALFPFIFDGSNYWFITIYLLLFILTPLLSPAINKISRRQLGMIVLVLLSVWCIFPRLVSPIIKVQDFGLSFTSWFIAMYLVGAYIKKADEDFTKHKKLFSVLLILSMAAFIGSRIFVSTHELSGHMAELIGNILTARDISGIFPTFIPILMFIAFKDIDIKVPPFLFTVSAATFGVYLIHDHLLFNDFLWQNILHTTTLIDNKLYIPYSVLCVAVVFTVCILIEILRKRFIETPLFSLKPVESFFEKADKWLVSK